MSGMIILRDKGQLAVLSHENTELFTHSTHPPFVVGVLYRPDINLHIIPQYCTPNRIEQSSQQSNIVSLTLVFTIKPVSLGSIVSTSCPPCQALLGFRLSVSSVIVDCQAYLMRGCPHTIGAWLSSLFPGRRTNPLKRIKTRRAEC